jgi:triacylglycerol lipase
MGTDDRGARFLTIGLLCAVLALACSSCRTDPGPDPDPSCDPACDEPNTVCVDGGCACDDEFHDGGDGACVESGDCSEGFGILPGGEDCLPLEEVCSEALSCEELVGWSAGECQYAEAPDGSSCEGESPDPCETRFECEAGTCVGSWAPCSTPRPVIFVHGVNGSSANFDTMAQRLAEDGWPEEYLIFFDAEDPAWGCNVDNADAIQLLVDDTIEATCQPRVDVVAHSMGTLSSRYYVKNLGGTELVNTYATLGGQHHGLASPCFAPDWLNVCVWQELCETGEFIAQLNEEPATPGEAWWVSMYGTADDTVPNSSSYLGGAENIEFVGVEHSGANGLLEVEEVYDEVRRVLEYPCW